MQVNSKDDEVNTIGPRTRAKATEKIEGCTSVLRVVFQAMVCVHSARLAPILLLVALTPNSERA